MLLADQPSKIQLPFANSGTKNTIPVPSQIGITDGLASFTDGFPPLTMTPIASGGKPPFGADFNGVLNAITAIQRWQSGGGLFTYDATWSTANSGYSKGALLLKVDGSGYWVNEVDGNTSNPDTGGAGWLSWNANSDAPGIIKDFGGEMPPDGYFECDGSSLLRSAYPELFAAIGTLHGAADALHFNIPDHRGKFKRGWAHGTANDPNASSRSAAATGGATGDHVGTGQGHAVQDHAHNTLGTNTAIGAGLGSGVLASGANNTGGMASGNIATETRPINAAVMSIIKY